VSQQLREQEQIMLRGLRPEQRKPVGSRWGPVSLRPGTALL